MLRRKVFADVVVPCDPNSASFFVIPRPGQGRILEATVQDKQLSILRERCSRLNQRSRGFTRFDNYCGLGKGRHGLVALGKEKSVLSVILMSVAVNRYLRDKQEVFCNECLEFFIFLRIIPIDWSTNDGDRFSASINRGFMRCCINSPCKTRH